MPKLEYFLVCESVSTDRDTNRISLFSVLEDFQVVTPGQDPSTEGESQLKLVAPQFVAVSCWNRKPEDEGKDFQATLRVHTPNQEPKDFPFNFMMDRPRYRLTMHFQGMPKLEAGELRFELRLNGEHVAWHTVNILPATAV